MVCIREFLTVLDRIADPALAESWDNVGMLVGDPGSKISGILVALDPTLEILAEAKRRGCNTIITHHPLIFKGIKSVRTDHPDGRILAQALIDRLTIIGCHTNLDKVPGGVNDMLASCLGLVDVQVLAPDPAGLEGIGFGRIGKLSLPLTFTDFAKLLREKLNAPVLKAAGPRPAEIDRVAVCGGSGSDLTPTAMAGGAQIYVSSEIKHSMARWAESVGFCVVDCGHFATENVVVAGLAERIRKGFAGLGTAVEVFTTQTQVGPFWYC